MKGYKDSDKGQLWSYAHTDRRGAAHGVKLLDKGMCECGDKRGGWRVSVLRVCGEEGGRGLSPSHPLSLSHLLAVS